MTPDERERVFHDALPRGAQYVVGDLGEYLAPALLAVARAAAAAERERWKAAVALLVESRKEHLRCTGYAGQAIDYEAAKQAEMSALGRMLDRIDWMFSLLENTPHE